MIKKKPFKAKIYEILDYIEKNADGAYININISNHNYKNFGYETDIYVLKKDNGSWPALYGSLSGANYDGTGNYGFYLHNSDNQVSVRAGTGNGQVGNHSATTLLQNWCNVIYNRVDTLQELTINGNKQTRTGGNNGGTNITPFLFGVNNGSGIVHDFQARIRKFKAYENGILVRDYIPVKRLKDNAYGMLDTLTNTFYGNAGTGAFSGQSLSTPEYIEEDVEQVDYIQSSGTQYIDTNFVPSTNTKVEIDIKTLSTIGNWDIICMARNYQLSRDGSTNQFAFYLGGSKTSVGTYSANTRYAITFDGKNSRAIINGTTYPLTKGTTAITEKLLLFCQEGTGGFISAQTFSAKIYDNDVLKLDLVPVKYGTEYCMLDTISGNLYFNKGTGTFSGGDITHKTHIYKHRFIGNNVEYEELNYIESTGTQSIKLGNSIPFNTDNTVIECDFQFTEIATDSNAKWLFSNQGSSGNMCDFYSQVNTEHNGFYLRPSASQSSQVGVTIPHDTNKHHMKADFVNKKLYFDDDVYTLGYTQSSQTAAMYLFRRANTSTGYAKIKLFNFKYTRVLHHDADFDLIPAKRVSDGVIGLYNKIDKSFLTNAGTGTFVSGERIEKVQSKLSIKKGTSRYRILDYIKTDGNSVIDTGVIVKKNISKLEIDMNITTNTNNHQVGCGGNDADVIFFTRGYVYLLNASQGGTAYTIPINERKKYIADAVNNKIGYEGNLINLTPTANQSKDTFTIGARKHDGVYELGGSDIIYDFKAYENNNLVCHLVPVERNDGVIGMLDLVSGNFKTNSSSGSFTKGNYIEKLLS